MTQRKHISSWMERPLWSGLPVTWGHVAFGLILVLVVLTRLVDLGVRVQSHDESLHTYFSWLLYRGQGYQHTPMMHGPLQFHLMALSYFLFGDNDFTARLPHALFGILAVAFLWRWRRYLGRYGVLAAAFLMLISPYMLYYSRYARNEALIMLLAVVMWWALLEYLTTGNQRSLYWLTGAVAFHFIVKETAFIYTAQALVFLALVALDEVARTPWRRSQWRKSFLILALLGLVGMALALSAFALSRTLWQQPPLPAMPEAAEVATPVVDRTAFAQPARLLALFFGGVGGFALLSALGILIYGYSWERLRRIRSIEAILLLFSLVLPLLAPFPLFLKGIRVGEYRPELLKPPLVYQVGGVTLLFILLAVGLGILWDWKRWWRHALLFWTVFTVFYTTVFTYGPGFVSGLLSSLGYWLEQQGVKRGNQPWYYYLVVQIPIYEYLPALALIMASLHMAGRRVAAWLRPLWASSMAFREKPESSLPPGPPEPREKPTSASDHVSGRTERTSAVPAVADRHVSPSPSPRGLTFAFLLYWSLSATMAYTIAGEKMPWLTVHIALPMILLAAWWFHELVTGLSWHAFFHQGGWVPFLAGVTFVLAFPQVFRPFVFPASLPFQDKTLVGLMATADFAVNVLISLAAAGVLVYSARRWPLSMLARWFILAFFGVLAAFTWHTAYQAAYVHYDQANEFLVYAHSAHGVRVTMNLIEEVGRRLYDGREIPVAYDDAVSWPFSWYLRNYPKARYYGATPNADLQEAPIVLAGVKNWTQVENFLGNRFYTLEYLRMVWPHEDIYRGLTWERIRKALSDPAMREALWHIWLNRDFTQYAKVTDKDLSLAKWTPGDRMRVYVRKDVAARMWEFGIGQEAAVFEEFVQPGLELYVGKGRDLQPVLVLGGPGMEPGQFQHPRDLVLAPDGTLYVADTWNHRIQHLSPEGQVLHVWGTPTNLESPDVPPPGTFAEPWGLALDAEGRVYVADTWNHRIQVFGPEGEFLLQWGRFGQGEAPDTFWGPRDVVVDDEGYVIVADTGNKRLVVFDRVGHFVEQIGGGGVGPGQFDEPVGLALDSEGYLYVADTWNERVQVFQPLGGGLYVYSHEWRVPGWDDEHLENKPYLAVDDQGRVYVTVPMLHRVAVFSRSGELLYWWGQGVLGLVNGVGVDAQGGVWVTDATASQVLRFLPEPSGAPMWTPTPTPTIATPMPTATPTAEFEVTPTPSP